MKTADLIPLILLELNESNKYGLEITKSIETKSNGKIIIKQPTLYTILKKLEKSKFISSYWEDSDIGGKRHYYKITENGRLQVSTLPSIEILIDNIISNDEDTLTSSEQENSSTISEQISDEINASADSIADEKNTKAIDEPITSEPTTESTISIMDALATDTLEEILPSEEVFSSNNIDHSTQVEINQANRELLKDEDLKKDDIFANNTEVAKFTSKPQSNITNEYKEKVSTLTENENLSPKISPIDAININRQEIKYVDYVDIKKDEKYIYAKHTAKNILHKVLLTSAYALLMLIVCAIITSFKGVSALYNICLIVSLCFAIFYPAIYAFKYQQIRLELKEKPIKIDMKKRLFIYIGVILIVFIICVIVSVSTGNNSIAKTFNINNFANIYAPILLASTVFADYLFTYIFILKRHKK